MLDNSCTFPLSKLRVLPIVPRIVFSHAAVRKDRMAISCLAPLVNAGSRTLTRTNDPISQSYKTPFDSTIPWDRYPRMQVERMFLSLSLSLSLSLFYLFSFLSSSSFLKKRKRINISTHEVNLISQTNLSLSNHHIYIHIHDSSAAVVG